MCYRTDHLKNRIFRIFVLFFLVPFISNAEIKTWTGFGGDMDWSNPLNWSGASLPLPTDDVMLDNSDLPVSYQVNLPGLPVTLKTLHIYPSPGRNIELILPATNLMMNALTVTGPGYGIELNAGAIFRNASGLSSGESLFIADSIMIHDGGRYIHQTRASHANSILKFLSTAPGTEQGIFDFDVPKASYTISVSNRTYGSLELHATALGAPVNYTCTGANPLIVRGDLRIGANVSVSMDLSGANGNMLVEGDFIQEGGQLNLASGAGDNTILRVNGDLYQSSTATITESNNGNPVLELSGNRLQVIAMAGKILNQVGFRIHNVAGAVLSLPLTLPWLLYLDQGEIYSSATALLTIDVNCNLVSDSSNLMGSYVDGPLRKLGLTGQDHFLFPVGKGGNMRWLELKNASGNYTVEYIHQDPSTIGNTIGRGLDHISKLEYWTVLKDGVMDDQSKLELSFSSLQSGGVTDPNYLNVAKFQSAEWEDAGHTAITGNYIQGSVLSSTIDFSANEYTLASTVNLENPLPFTSIDLQVTEVSKNIVFNWTLSSTEIPDHFDLYEVLDSQLTQLAKIPAADRQIKYSWSDSRPLQKGNHYFRVVMIDVHGNEFPGKIVLFKEDGINPILTWVSSGILGKDGKIMIVADLPDDWEFEILAINGRIVKKGLLNLGIGRNYIEVEPELVSQGIYIFRAVDSSGKNHSLIFRKG
jgi:hypothetical protein